MKLKKFEEDYQNKKKMILVQLQKKETTVLARQELNQQLVKLEDQTELYNYIMLTHKVVSDYTDMLDNENSDHMQQDNNIGITQYITKYDNIEKQRLTEIYCKMMNNGLMIDCKKLVIDNSLCVECNNETQKKDGFVVCSECGFIDERNVVDFQTSYKSPFSYKRSNRYHEILATLQAKENTDIPDYVLEAVKREIEKEHNLDVNDVTKEKIKQYLKKLSMTNYYEHAPHILNKINGITPTQIPQEVEDKLIEMFNMIQEPFEIVKAKVAPNRLSFLSYNYVLVKFTELLDLPEYKQCFTLLKSVDKLRLQDKIFSGICDILGWEFIPSI